MGAAGRKRLELAEDSSLNRRRVSLLVLALLAFLALHPAFPPAYAAGLTCALSATTSGLSASFSGSISGGSGTYAWTLSFGDDLSTSGTGSTVSASHTYRTAGTYTATLNAQTTAVGGGTLYASCSTQLVVTNAFSLSVQDGLAVSDQATYLPPLRIADSFSVLDRPSLIGPSPLNESAAVTDKVEAFLLSSAALNPVILAAIVAVAIVGVGLVLWKLVLLRLRGR